MDAAGYTVTTAKGKFVLNREELPNTSVSIFLPDFLEDLSEDELNQKFPISKRPAIVKSNTEYKAAFIVGATDVEVPEDLSEEQAVQELFATQQKTISRLVPGYQEYGVQSKKIEDHTIICLEYMSHSVEDDLYNIFFLLVHEGKMIYGTFSNLLEEAREMSLVFLACLNSVQFISDDINESQ